jgi:hypothetical protein
MAIPGPKPKDASKRARANAETFPTVELNHDQAPKKARSLPGASKLTAATRRRWRTWATSPQAALFLETDWLVLERLAKLWDAFERGDVGVAGEIRLTEAKLGATTEDRLRLRWRLAEAKSGEERPAAVRKSSRGRKDPRLTLVGDDA